ncbi:MAG TPA: hypothetical protein VK982_13870 [Bacteroidales bacterium]|nr:hypothetical protein [Bacteroidales bacterium]
MLNGKKAFRQYFYTNCEYFRIFEFMDNEDFNKDKLIEYWITGSDDDYETMIAMFDSKRFSWPYLLGT